MSSFRSTGYHGYITPSQLSNICYSQIIWNVQQAEMCRTRNKHYASPVCGWFKSLRDAKRERQLESKGRRGKKECKSKC